MPLVMNSYHHILIIVAVKIVKREKREEIEQS